MRPCNVTVLTSPPYLWLSPYLHWRRLERTRQARGWGRSSPPRSPPILCAGSSRQRSPPPPGGTCTLENFHAVFRIRDILRLIRILKSVHGITDPNLDPNPFRHWHSRCQQKESFFLRFFAQVPHIYINKSSKITSNKIVTTVEITIFQNFFASNNNYRYGSSSRRPKTLRIRNTAFSIYKNTLYPPPPPI